MVMEQKHKQRILAEFHYEMQHKELYVLNIPDDYRYMDGDLIEEITAAVDPILNQF